MNIHFGKPTSIHFTRRTQSSQSKPAFAFLGDLRVKITSHHHKTSYLDLDWQRRARLRGRTHHPDRANRLARLHLNGQPANPNLSMDAALRALRSDQEL